MFSKKMVLIIGVLLLIVTNVLVLSTVNKEHQPTAGKIVFIFVSPVQESVTSLLRFLEDVWRHYFFLVETEKENDALQRQMAELLDDKRRSREIYLANERLRELLNFKQTLENRFISAEIVGRDPSPWYKTVVIDKGLAEGVCKGAAALVATGVAGQVIDSSQHYAKVLLAIDQNAAVDALIQRIRARGVIRGNDSGGYQLAYVLRKHDVQEGDVVVSSGLDSVFPKGVSIGFVSSVTKREAEIFQEITVTPFVDFEKLEEVMVLVKSQADNETQSPAVNKEE